MNWEHKLFRLCRLHYKPLLQATPTSHSYKPLLLFLRDLLPMLLSFSPYILSLFPPPFLERFSESIVPHLEQEKYGTIPQYLGFQKDSF